MKCRACGYSGKAFVAFTVQGAVHWPPGTPQSTRDMLTKHATLYACRECGTVKMRSKDD